MLRSGGQSTWVSSCLLGGRPLPKLGDCSRCARPAGTLAAEKYVLAGGAGQNMILSFSAGCGRRNSARRALPGESVGRKGIGYPAGKLPPPKPSPWGEGGPAQPGRMRGRPCTQPFLVEKRCSPACRLNGIFLLPRWATRSPPHQSPSVTASPQGEAVVGGTPPQQNTFSPTPCSRKMRIQIRARTWAP